MHYCEDPQFVFIPNPKTGTRSTLEWLRQRYEVKMWEGEDGLKGTHYTGIPKRMQDWPSFTVVRNPYDRMVSLWWTARHMKKFRRWPIKRYLTHTFRPQSKWGNAAKIVLKFEEIPECLKQLPFWHDGKFPWANDSRFKNKTRKGIKWDPIPPKDEVLTPDVKTLIAKKYSMDFELYGYKP